MPRNGEVSERFDTLRSCCPIWKRLEFSSRGEQVETWTQIRYTCVSRYRDVSERGMRNVAVKGWYREQSEVCRLLGENEGMTGADNRVASPRWRTRPASNPRGVARGLPEQPQTREWASQHFHYLSRPAPQLCSERFTHSRAARGCETLDISAYDYTACSVLFDIPCFNNATIISRRLQLAAFACAIRAGS